MLRKASTGFAAFAFAILACSISWAQCNCGSCNNDSLPVGTDYTDVGGCESGNCDSGSCGSETCGSDCYGVTDRCCDVFNCRYASFYGGGNWIQSFEESGATTSSLDVDDFGFDDGTIVGFAVGAQVHPQVRYEMDFSYRRNDAESWNVQQFAAGALVSQVITPASGRVSSYAGMANIVYDFKPRQVGCFNAYVGGGLGFASLDGDIVSATDTFVVDDTSIAYQGFLGVSKAISQRLDVFVEGRFMAAPNVDVINTTTGTSIGDLEYLSGSALFGVRFRR